jgi:hypothetical protein
MQFLVFQTLKSGLFLRIEKPKIDHFLRFEKSL